MPHLSVILSRRTKGGNEDKEKDNQQETTDKWAVEQQGHNHYQNHSEPEMRHSWNHL